VALRDGTLLDPAWWDRISTFQVFALDEPENQLGYGYGFEVDRKAGLLRVGHAGGSGGVSARLDLYPELGYAVILLSNYDRATRHPADHLGALLARAEEPR
jgi:CubicO group peptidase (beta-lactamase class C family)